MASPSFQRPLACLSLLLRTAAKERLRQCPDYSAIGDEGAALATLIEPGVSRRGPNQEHGNGFKPIFERLANATGQLRFPVTMCFHSMAGSVT